MSFSKFLDSRRASLRLLVSELKPHFSYVSILGSDVLHKAYRADRNTSAIRCGSETECGFVVKLTDGEVIFEYSFDDLPEDIRGFARKIRDAFSVSAALKASPVGGLQFGDEPLKKSFSRPADFEEFTDDRLLAFCQDLSRELQGKSEHILNPIVSLTTLETSKLFLSPNRELDQNYTWVNGAMTVMYQENDKILGVREMCYGKDISPVLRELPERQEKLLDKAHHLVFATPITPGVYDVITDASITGLIAHEAFGHGVEMDQFVKDRALAKEYVGKYVASPICNMKDGAASALSVASYFFDDDGILAGDTQIIRDGILLTGISDMASAAQLGTVPTGNGRRESTRRKAYTRMTNTFFEAGSDRLSDMIASVKHGYMLFETNNGMEDPKNWAIQCVAEYGIEIVDGKLTDHYVSPVVMSGYVPDLLKSISMISGDSEIEGAGHCGKGYKEWVRVSSGGPELKVKVKLG